MQPGDCALHHLLLHAAKMGEAEPVVEKLIEVDHLASIVGPAGSGKRWIAIPRLGWSAVPAWNANHRFPPEADI